MIVLDPEALKNSKITIGLIIVNGMCFLLFNILLPFQYILLFVQINSKILEGEYWRLFTPMFLHADIMHLLFNMIALLFFGAAVENNYDRMEYVLIYFIAGFMGNFFSLLLLPPDVISLGASGAIFGLIGAAFVMIAREDPSLLLFGLLYLFYFIGNSFAPGINAYAHLSGLAAGLILGYLLYQKKAYEDIY